MTKVLDSNSDWSFFDQPAEPNHILDFNPPISDIQRMVSMTNSDGSEAASRWLRVLEE